MQPGQPRAFLLSVVHSFSYIVGLVMPADLCRWWRVQSQLFAIVENKTRIKPNSTLNDEVNCLGFDYSLVS